MIDFAGYMDQERARIKGERDALLTQQSDIEGALEQLNRDMQAIDAYAAAKAGKSVLLTRSSRARPARTNGAARHGSRRGAIVAAVSANPQGLGRGELLHMLDVKGDKSGEMAVSNALTALVKSNTLTRNEGKYVLAV